ncbi:L,D-transpeptidase family protein [Methylocystis echinoides]|uniref:L,D-transpeptidase family protein n=1 Tax=Methylocystis echinoides TaxID=29468 RepID=UPI0034164308
MRPPPRRIVGSLLAASVSSFVLLTHPALALDFFALFDREPPRSEAAPAAPTHLQKATPAPPPAKAVRREPPKPARPVVAAPQRDAKPYPEAAPGLPLFGVVSIADQQISIYNHNGLVTRSPVSTGMEGHATPKGIFTIIGRERFHKSNIYSGAPMPFMQRITWSGIAMHVGVVPGHPASHGCVRLPADFAEKLWGMTKIGERIVIAPDDVPPAVISHAVLPEPKIYVAAEPGREAFVYGPPDSGDEPGPSPRLNPRQYAERLKARAAAEAISASKALKAAAALERAAQDEAASAARALAAAEAASSTAQGKADAADEAYLAATAKAHALQTEASLGDTDDSLRRTRYASAMEAAATARAAAAAAKVAFATASIEAKTALSAARASLAAKEAALSDAAGRLTQATAASAAASKADAEARRRLAPLSVLISKKDQRLYVRQGLTPLFDAPISVRDPERPLGSHLFIASAANEDATGLKWSVLSVPGVFDAAEALDRIDMAPEIRARIGERLWTGASIIVSDQPPSSETGADGTDLTVKLR